MKAPDALLPGTVWWNPEIKLDTKGKAAPRKRFVSFQITRREASDFDADWYDGYSRWKIQGTIQDGQISWKAEDVKKNNGQEPGYDTARTITGDQITLRYSGCTGDQIPYSTEFTLNLSQTP